MGRHLSTPTTATLADLAQELGLNDWAVEDAVAEAERTKATIYRTHTFFTVYAVSCQRPTDEPSRRCRHTASPGSSCRGA